MESDRFDNLSRLVGEQPDRRSMLKAAAGGALGLLGITTFGEDAFARRCNNNRDCRRGQKCVNEGGPGRGRCKDKNRNECNNDNDCRKNEECRKGRCRKVECNNNNDCRPDEKCRKGECKNRRRR